PMSDPLGPRHRRHTRRLDATVAKRKYPPVRLRLGRLRLETMPRSTGSAPAVNTIGMVAVAALAASAAGGAIAMITAAGSATSSAANAGSRSKRPSADRYLIAILRPSI